MQAYLSKVLSTLTALLAHWYNCEIHWLKNIGCNSDFSKICQLCWCHAYWQLSVYQVWTNEFDKFLPLQFTWYLMDMALLAVIAPGSAERVPGCSQHTVITATSPQRFWWTQHGHWSLLWQEEAWEGQKGEFFCMVLISSWMKSSCCMTVRK